MAQKLSEIIRDQGLDFGLAIETCEHLKLWDGVVAENVRQHAEAVKIVKKTLYVKTSSPAWANELTYLKAAIVDKFNERAGRKVIDDIRFKNA